MFALGYLERHGITCTANSDEGKVSIKHSTKGTNFGLRDSAYEGWTDLTVAPGDILTINDNKHIVISSEEDMGATFFVALKTNSLLDSQKGEWEEDDNGYSSLEWSESDSNIPAYGQIVTSALRQTDPGILNTTTRIYYLNASVSVLDRIIHHCTEDEAEAMGGFYESPGMKLKVDSVDDIMLPNVKRIQCSHDER